MLIILLTLNNLQSPVSAPHQTVINQPTISAQTTRFALTCIGTETGYTINFSYRWGSGSWIESSVSPGKWRPIRWDYDFPGQNRSPTLVIRYDDDATSRVNMVRTEVRSFAASAMNCEAQGRTYNFYQLGNEIFLRED